MFFEKGKNKGDICGGKFIVQSCIIRETKSITLNWMGHVGCMGEMRNDKNI
jgi:hypothetical protein